MVMDVPYLSSLNHAAPVHNIPELLRLQYTAVPQNPPLTPSTPRRLSACIIRCAQGAVMPGEKQTLTNGKQAGDWQAHVARWGNGRSNPRRPCRSRVAAVYGRKGQAETNYRSYC